MPIRIDALDPVAAATLTTEIPAMIAGVTVKLTVGQFIDLLVDGAPIALDTWLELVGQIEANEDGLTAILTALDGKLSLAGGTMSGDVDFDGNSILNLLQLNGADATKFVRFDSQSLSDAEALQLRTNAKAGVFNAATATLSGTSQILTGIPSGVNWVKVIFDSTFSGLCDARFELGDASSFPGSGYAGVSQRSAGGVLATDNINAAYINVGNTSADRIQGCFELERWAGSNVWNVSYSYKIQSSGFVKGEAVVSGLASELTRLRVGSGGAQTMGGSAQVKWRF